MAARPDSLHDRQARPRRSIFARGLPIPSCAAKAGRGPLAALSPVAADVFGRWSMWRSVLLAAGIFACILGVEMLVVDSAVLVSLNGQSGERNFQAPDWAPWTLLSVGAATILHFCQLPRMSQSPHPPYAR